MNKSTRQTLKDALISFLNTSLKYQHIEDVRVVDMTDDFETAMLEHSDGTRGVVKPEIILPVNKEAEDESKNQNRSRDPEVERVRRTRINNA